jgi:type I restriction enzyme S subunit
MNAKRLLKHYERIADAPDAIARLRHFILDLAVRGKLVPQDSSDEPATELLRRIAKEKARLVKAGEIRDKSPLPAVADDEEPFEVPKAWRWVRFANIADFSAGRTPSRNDSSYWNSGDHAWISIADMDDGQVLMDTKETISDKARKRIFGSEPEPPGTIIMSFKLTIGKIARLGIPAFHNEAIISIKPHLADLKAYLFKALPQFARQGDTKGAIKGATLNRDSISNILFPLPPFAEQHRIVAKVDELMVLCDRLESKRSERESTRDRLAAASLARLNSPDPATFQDDARFALDTLQALTTRPDQIKQLRQTILNLAVRGKLVPQEPNDEPASELLKRIAVEKARLVNARRNAPSWRFGWFGHQPRYAAFFTPSPSFPHSSVLFPALQDLRSFLYKTGIVF